MGRVGRKYVISFYDKGAHAASKLLMLSKSNSPREPMAKVSARERQLIVLAGEGKTDIEISQQLKISPATVSVYWTRLRSKLRAKSRTEAVALAFRYQAEHDQRRLQDECNRVVKEAAEEKALTDAIRQVIESAADGVFISDPRGALSYANPALEQLFGYGRRSLVGRNISDLMPERNRAQHHTYVSDYLLRPTHRRMGHGLYVKALKSDGTEIGVCITLSTFGVSPNLYVVGMVRDYSREAAILGEYLATVGDQLQRPELT